MKQTKITFDIDLTLLDLLCDGYYPKAIYELKRTLALEGYIATGELEYINAGDRFNSNYGTLAVKLDNVLGLYHKAIKKISVVENGNEDDTLDTLFKSYHNEISDIGIKMELKDIFIALYQGLEDFNKHNSLINKTFIQDNAVYKIIKINVIDYKVVNVIISKIASSSLLEEKEYYLERIEFKQGLILKFAFDTRLNNYEKNGKTNLAYIEAMEKGIINSPDSESKTIQMIIDLYILAAKRGIELPNYHDFLKDNLDLIDASNHIRVKKAYERLKEIYQSYNK